MTDNNQPASALRQRMLEDMHLRKLSAKTQSAYIRAVKKFAAFLGRSPARAQADIERQLFWPVVLPHPEMLPKRIDRWGGRNGHLGILPV